MPQPLEKAMAPHSSTLAWKIPWMEEPGWLQSMGSLGVGHDWMTSLSLFTHALEKKMATHSSVLAWRIPGTGEPSRLPSMESHRVGHDWSDLAAAAAPTTNAEEVEVERFYEDLQDLIELTSKKDVLFIMAAWNANVGSEEISGVMGNLAFE